MNNIHVAQSMLIISNMCASEFYSCSYSHSMKKRNKATKRKGHKRKERKGPMPLERQRSPYEELELDIREALTPPTSHTQLAM